MLKTSLRWVFQRYGSKAEQKTALCIEGTKKWLCIAAGPPLRVLVRPASQATMCRKVMREPWSANARPYPVPEAVEKLRDLGEQKGMTDSARSLLLALEKAVGALKEGETEVELDIDVDGYSDEEHVMFENPNPTGDDADDEKDAAESNGGQAADDAASDSPKPAKAKRARKAPAAAAAKSSDDEGSANAQETDVTTKKAKAATRKTAASKKTTAPAKTAKGNGAAKPRKARVSHAKLPKTQNRGPTPFRPGTAKEKAFIAYKGDHKKYEGMTREDRGEYADKLAKKLGISAGTLKSWISGQFAVALR